MELTHLCLFVARKDLVAYSILSTLYRAAENGSIVREYLSRGDVLSALKVFAVQPKSYDDVQHGLDSQLLYEEEISFPYMQKLWLIGGRNVQRRFERHLKLTLHQLYYQESCYGDGDGVLAFEFSDEELTLVVGYFCECVDFHLWAEYGPSYLCYFPYEVIRQLLCLKRSARYILRLFEAYLSNEIEDTGDVLEIFELKPHYTSRLLGAVETKRQFDLFLASDYKEYVTHKEIKAKATFFYDDLSWLSESEEESEEESDEGVPYRLPTRPRLPQSDEEESESE